MIHGPATIPENLLDLGKIFQVLKAERNPTETPTHTSTALKTQAGLRAKLETASRSLPLENNSLSINVIIEVGRSVLAEHKSLLLIAATSNKQEQLRMGAF
ncbi:uncharacterized [Tachysurus ichikawai]